MIYPDFTCLRLADRKTILWEHLGMMTDPIYCQKAMKKIDIYAKNGLYKVETLYIHLNRKIQSKHNECGKSHQSNI